MENSKVLRILMLEDSEDDVFLIERTLQKEKLAFVKERVDTEEEFISAIRNFKPDVVLSDHGLPGFNSWEALKISMRESPGSPFILVTGTVSDDFAITCIRQGADDYILKSNLSRLPSAIVNAVKKRRLEKLKREARHALRQQNEKLMKVNKELDSFVYSVSHNLRGPLASVIGLVNLLKGEENLATIQAMHTLMDKSLEKLDNTLADILDFAKNARNDVYLGEIDWVSLLNSSFTRLEHLDKDVEKNITIHSECAFYSDGWRIGIVMVNLLSNALTYRDADRQARIDLNVSVTEKFAIVAVKDNGVGMDEGIIPKVFTMFFRGNERSMGAGLGLYIVRETLQKLNGEITIRSKSGEGTTVTVVLPNLRLCELPETNDL